MENSLKITMLGFNPGGWKQTSVAVVVFLAWTLTSFLCHESAKMFLQLSEAKTSRSGETQPELFITRLSFAILLTSVQCICCLLFVRYKAGHKTIIQLKTLTLLIASHALATLATNYSMTFIEASSTLAIKLTEPITMAVAHHVILRTAVPLQTAISIPLIICGALVFTGINIRHVSDTAGVVLAFASNIILAARNIALKKLQNAPTENSSMVLKPYTTICLTVLAQIVFVTLFYYLETQEVVTRNCSMLIGLSLTSGIFHVSYSYISTNIVLKVMNVISHSIANIFKRFLVVLMLSALGNRQISLNNFLGLALAICGLLIYKQVHKSTQHEGQTKGKVEVGLPEDSGKEPIKRKFLLNLLFLSLLSVTMLTLMDKPTFQTSPKTTLDNTHLDIFKENQGFSNMEAQSSNFSNLEKAETNPEMREFLSWRLVDHPEETDKRAATLTNSQDVVDEAQRILMNLLQDLLGNVKNVMLLEIATYENKGDAAIAVGEIMLLRRMNINIVYYCETSDCDSNQSIAQAIEVNKKYAKDELIILLQGGGNLVGYKGIDGIRKTIITTFPDRKIIIFSQSIWLNPSSVEELDNCRRIYSNRSNLIMFLRDRQSLKIARNNFKSVKLILAPDMAFGIGMIPRQLPPIYDILWLKREDNESSNYHLPVFPSNLSVDVSDWYQWQSNEGQTGMEHAFLIASAGFQFLQRGRVVITDRLHGHILSTLMNIPHVLIDNPPHLKLSSFDKSWTKGLSNTILVSNGSLALEAAKELLKRFDSSLPSVGPKDMYVVKKVKPTLLS